MENKAELISKLNTLLIGMAEFKDEKCMRSKTKESLKMVVNDINGLSKLWLETIIPEAKSGNPNYLLIVETLRDYNSYFYRLLTSFSLKLPSKNNLPKTCSCCKIKPPIPSNKMAYTGKRITFNNPTSLMVSNEGWRVEATISSDRDSFEPISPLKDETLPKIYFVYLECPECGTRRDLREAEQLEEFLLE